jgi:NAD(P)-dependent dehydrogenase (short-subunit alcohol dehydrogenase family)
VDTSVAIITGAGSGIGRATAIELARDGFDLLLAGRTEASLRTTAELVANEANRASSMRAGVGRPLRVLVHVDDLSTPGGNLAMIEACGRELGRLDALINNAGQAEIAPIERSTPKLIDRIFRINALGPAYAIHYAWPALLTSARSGRRPAIVNISSIATVDPLPGFFAYAASKAALNLLTQSTAKEGADLGVRAFCVAPGAVETPMLRSAFDESKVPRNQALAPEVVARVIAQCLRGEHDTHVGRAIPVLPESAKGWYQTWVRDHPPMGALG